MMKYMLIILLICTSTFASTIPHQSKDIIPHQSKELIELYTRLDYIIYKDLKLEHTYKVFDDIFIVPDEFYGEAEYYDLKFYLDMDTTINNDYDANCYRILYENRTQISESNNYRTVIPEPSTITLFFVSSISLILRKRKN